MRTARLRRQAAACRGPIVLFSLFFLLRQPLFAADAATGVVVAQSGQPLPRAFVRVVDASGADAASAFSDENGVFRLAPIPAGCHVEASLTGFAPAIVPCDAAALR